MPERELAALGRFCASLTQFGPELLANQLKDEVMGALQQTGRRSRPGEAPDDGHGTLAASISVASQGGSAQLMVNAPFATYLEFGTVRMLPRPFLGPAVEKVSAEAAQVLAERFRF
ncbi:MAG: hypothetical protein JSS72_01885 [Armatimonadetes bacterium]|nr:hypothetical protein [Armatimonadota bacterium]